MIKILLVDDHKVVRDGIKLFLTPNDDMEVVGECSDGDQVMDELAQKEVDVILMDLNMPGKNGLDTIEEVMAEYPDVRILALTMHHEEGYISKALKNGAIGYALKDSGKDELLKAVRQVAAGEPYFGAQVSSIMMAKYMKNSQAGKAKGPRSRTSLISVDDLTEREKQVLRLIVQEKTNSEISEELFVSQRTVDSHRRNLLEKTGVKNTAGLVRFAFENNLVD